MATRQREAGGTYNSNITAAQTELIKERRKLHRLAVTPISTRAQNTRYEGERGEEKGQVKKTKKQRGNTKWGKGKSAKGNGKDEGQKNPPIQGHEVYQLDLTPARSVTINILSLSHHKLNKLKKLLRTERDCRG